MTAAPMPITAMAHPARPPGRMKKGCAPRPVNPIFACYTGTRRMIHCIIPSLAAGAQLNLAVGREVVP